MSAEYFKNNELASSVWAGKYAMKKGGKQVETTPLEMHKRMSKEFARAEKRYPNPLSEEKILEDFDGFSTTIPQGSVMSMLGNTSQIGSLSNCVVLPKTFDSYGGILFADQQLAQLYKRRAGCGQDLSTLRPLGSNVTNAAGASTGVPSFMERFSNTTREVAMAGRRGALMLTLNIKHPEALEFTQIKQDLSKVTGANVSLLLTDEFLEAVEGDQDYYHVFPIEEKIWNIQVAGLDEYNKLYEGSKPGTYYKKIKAKELWDKITEAAHKSAEPGLIYWDRQHVYSPSSIYPEFENISTNPLMVAA